jgi:catechol 2,3-dioxygenase-like lactoylglutathione lyase family enzyme
MFAPEKILHMTHVAADTPARRELERFYLEVFGAQTYYEARPVEGLERDETLILIGGLCLIPQSSTNLESEQGRLRASFAGRFAQMAIKVPDTESTEAHFRKHGLNAICLHPVYKKIFFMSDPKETVGVRYELCAVEMPNDLRMRPGWTADWWRDSHPLGIEKLASVATATADLAKASKFYGEVFEFNSLGQRDLPEEGAKVAAFKTGSKVPFVIEVMEPAGKGTPLSDYVAKYGGGLYSVNFKVKSLGKAAEYLKSKGLRLVGDEKRRFNIDPRDCFGVTFTFVDQDVPSQAR